MKVLLLNVLFMFINNVCLASNDNTGSPVGLMADCPGMNRSITLSKETRQSLHVVVFSKRKSFFSQNERKCRLTSGGAACAASVLDFRKTTKVMVSGYLDNSYSLFTRTVAALEISKGHNVMQMEVFPVLFRTYPMAARIARPVGELLGEFLARLSRKGLTGAKLEFVAASLGSHIAYYAAVRFKELTGQQPSRITALDPAGPCFRGLPASGRLNPSAATRVDAIHTNIDGFGIADPVGHIDFYANGGEFQPSMVSGFILPCFVLCSHVKAVFYWILAIQHPDQFIAVRCDDLDSVRRGDCYRGKLTTNYFGTKTNFNKTGLYYLPTREFPPYYMGLDGLSKRRYGVNTYLEQVSQDIDMVV